MGLVKKLSTALDVFTCYFSEQAGGNRCDGRSSWWRRTGLQWRQHRQCDARQLRPLLLHGARSAQLPRSQGRCEILCCRTRYLRLGRWRSTFKTDHVRGSYLLTARCCTNNVTASGMPCLSVSGAVEAKKESGGGEKSPQKNKSNLLVISGGEGYIDFRQGLTPAL